MNVHKNRQGNRRRLPRSRGAIPAAILSLALAGAAHAENVTLMAGPGGSTWDALSGAMKSMIETDAPDLSVNIRPGGGVSNVMGLASGQAGIAWVHAVVSADAIKGKDPFKAPSDNVCYLAAFHQSVMHIITTDPNVHDIASMKGASLGTVARGTSTELIVRQWLGMEGVTEEDLAQYNPGSMSDLADMMKDGHINVWMQLSGVPAGAMIDAMTSRPEAKLVPVSDELLNRLREDNPAWHAYVIKANSYPHQDQDVQTAGFSTLVGASCQGLSEQAGYEITKSLIKHYKELGVVISEIGDMSLPDIAADVGVPMHPGAKRAYEEAGVM